MKRGSGQGVLLSLVLLGIMVFGVVMAGRGWFPEVASKHGPGIQVMLNYTLWASGTFFVIGHIALAWLIFRAVRKPDESAGPAEPRREWKIGLIPAILMALVAEGGVLILGLPVWGEYYGPPPKDALTVEVTGQQFRWLIRYPGEDGSFGTTKPELIKGYNFAGLDEKDPKAGDDIVSVGEMVVPVDRPVRVILRSTDVIHSFFLREFRVKQDAMPGMNIELWFTPTKSGSYEIACNQICGLGHYQMRGFLEVVSESEYDKWLADQDPFFEE